MSLNPDLAALADYRAFLFEHWIHNVISKGGTFEICGPLGSPESSVGKIQISLSTIKRVKDWEDPKPDIYYQPLTRVYGAVDSWIPSVGLFQITTSVDRDINEYEIGKIMSKSKINKLIFVVPKEIYSTFPRIKIVSKKRKRGTAIEKEVFSTLADQVEQYVMKIDLDSFLF